MAQNIAKLVAQLDEGTPIEVISTDGYRQRGDYFGRDDECFAIRNSGGNWWFDYDQVRQVIAR